MKFNTFIKLILFLLLISSLGFAENETKSQKVNWVSGVVESIQEGQENSLVGVIMSNGENFNFSSTNDKLQGIKLGDSISAKVVGGWAESLEELKEAIKVTKPKKDSKGPQWVYGEITAIREDQENSLIRVKMPNGENFNIATSNELLQGFRVGEYITVKVVKGWAESIVKSEKK